eukprot:Nk52_evm22s2133 gene=Nk52_evmTU22s2133
MGVGKESMESDLKDKIDCVQKWLYDILGSDIPPFEINKETIDFLYRLRSLNVQSDSDCEVRRKDLKIKAHEYKSEEKRLCSVLEKMGLNRDSFSKSGNLSLRTLSAIAVSLELKNPTVTSVFCAIADLKMDLCGVVSKVNDRKMELRNSRVQLASLNKRIQEVQNLVDKLESNRKSNEVAVDKKKKEIAFYRTKGKEYKAIVESLERQLSSLNVHFPNTPHATIVNLIDEVASLKEAILPLQASYNGYNNLPADNSLARLKIEEAKQELVSMTE